MSTGSSVSPEILISEENGVRYLHFGSDWVQGAMRVSRPWDLELDYTRDMMFPLLLAPPRWPRRVLLVGLGAGSLTKFVHRHRPQARLTVVEIAPAVISVARQSFRVPASRRINLTLGDAADYLAGCEETFDLILVDGFDAQARAGKLDTVRFYAHCRRCLEPGGWVSVNLLRRSRQHRIGLSRMVETFGARVLALPETADGNTVVLATRGDPVRMPRALLQRRAARLARETRLDLRDRLDAVLGGRASLQI